MGARPNQGTIVRTASYSGPISYELVRVELTEENVLFTLCPSVATICRQATMMSANMTAYSTAAGPSSLVKNW